MGGEDVPLVADRAIRARSRLRACGEGSDSLASASACREAVPCLPIAIHGRNARRLLEHVGAHSSANRFAVSPTELCAST